MCVWISLHTPQLILRSLKLTTKFYFNERGLSQIYLEVGEKACAMIGGRVFFIYLNMVFSGYI